MLNRRVRPPTWLVFLLMLAGLMTATSPPRSSSAADALLGTIEGSVSYQTDSKRPWRYSRYYIKRVSTGELAEAVVALRGKSLRDAAPAPAAKTAVVDQQSFQFVPETTAIRVGDSIKFTNSDAATHNVQATSELGNFNVTMPTGGSHTVKFERAGGTRNYLRIGCVFHSAMQAFIFVFDHGFYAITPASGKFRLDEIPPGDYELEMVHAAGQLRWKQRVTVKAGETLRVDIRVSPDDKF